MSEPKAKSFGVSISVLLVVAIGGLVALATGAVLLLSAYANFKNTSELVLGTAQSFMESLEEDVTEYLVPAQNLVEYLVQQAENGNFDPSIKQETVLVLSGVLAAAPQISDIVLWQPDGREMVVKRGEAGKLIFEIEDKRNDEMIRKFIAEVRKDRKTKWNRPFRVGRATLISVVAPLYRDGKFLGVAGAAISLQQLSSLVEGLSKVHGTTGFILYGKDHLLAHARLPQLPTAKLSRENPLHKVAALADPVVNRILATPADFTAPNRAFDVRELEVNDVSYAVLSRQFTVFGEVPWTLAQYSSKGNWDAQIKRLDRSIIGGVVLLILAILAAIILARRIAAPVRSTAEAALKIGDLEFGQIERLPQSRITELNNQANAFNQMLDGLRWFETYVPRQLVRRLIQQKQSATVESKEQNLTVMFTDIVGFTAMSENMKPAETADMLNQHFEVLFRCIEAEGGTLDKYIGDAAMAFWGAPEEQSDHAARACRAALAAQEAFADMEPQHRVKYAIHTGPLIVGNIGAVGRMNYTVIGDTVNTCSRIEKLAGDLDDGSSDIILVSDATAELLDDDSFELKPAGEFAVKGREEPVTVYRLYPQSE